MARPPNAIRPVTIRISIPETVVAQMDLELYSELEGRVPYSARTRFIQQLVLGYFDKKQQAATAAAAKEPKDPSP